MKAGYAIASLVFPGLGQGLSGRWIACAVWVVLGFVVWPLIAVSVWCAAALVLVRIASAIDATRKAKLPSGAGLAVAAVVGVLAANGLGQLAARMFLVEPFKIPSSAMYPTLQIGDHLFINKLARDPSRGAVVVLVMPCDPERDYVKRVVALAGDTVEVRCNKLFINGAALPLVRVEAATSYDDYDEGANQTFARTVSRWREAGAYDVFHSTDADDGEMKDFPHAYELPGCQSELSGRAAQDVPKGELHGNPDGPRCEPHQQYVVPPGTVFVLGDNRNNSNDSRYWGPVPVANIKGTVVGLWWAKDLARLGAVR